jgi:hypothetical protein
MRAIQVVMLTLVLASGVSRLHADQLAAPSAPAPAAADALVIPLELLANRPIVRFTVNGQGPFAFLVAPTELRSLIDPELAEALKLRQPKAGAPELTVDLGFGAAAKTLKVPIAVEDIARLAADFGREMRPRGILSLAAWKDHMVTVDYLQWRVTIEAGALPEPNQKDVFALSSAGDFTLPVTIADHTLQCRVDPLFPAGLVLPLSSIVPQQMDGTARDGGAVKTSEGLVRVQEARLATNVMLGPFELKKPVVLLAETGQTATVGTPWLGRFAVTYDVTNGRVRLTSPAASLSRR